VCGLSLPQIGDVFEGRDHSTVHHSVKKIEQTVETNSAFSLQINDIINTVKGK
jgi:chromosomal replication initiation ATPase DnaA